jgi:hypothetical protein
MAGHHRTAEADARVCEPQPRTSIHATRTRNIPFQQRKTRQRYGKVLEFVEIHPWL